MLRCPSPDHSLSTRPKEAAVWPQKITTVPCLTLMPFSLAHLGHLDVTVGTRAGGMVKGVPALLCSRVVSATCSAIAHAETGLSLPGVASRNALHGLHAALPTARGR